jgi:HlyD family secretion protein
MSASVDITTEVKMDVPTVPIQSVTTREKDGDKKKTRAKLVSDKDNDDDKEKEKIREELEEVVFLSMEADTVSKVAVKTGIQDDTYIEILSGVKPGDEIVVGPYSAVARKLKSGEKIIKVDPDKFYEKN